MNGFEDYPVATGYSDAENEYSPDETIEEQSREGAYQNDLDESAEVSSAPKIENAEDSLSATSDAANNSDGNKTEDDDKADRELALLCRQLPELTGGEAMAAVKRERYGELRALGLSAREAYLATKERGVRPDNRSHLQSSVPKGSNAPKTGMSANELLFARELFGNLSDTEIKRLYQRVTK